MQTLHREAVAFKFRTFLLGGDRTNIDFIEAFSPKHIFAQRPEMSCYPKAPLETHCTHSHITAGNTLTYTACCRVSWTFCPRLEGCKKTAKTSFLIKDIPLTVTLCGMTAVPNRSFCKHKRRSSYCTFSGMTGPLRKGRKAQTKVTYYKLVYLCLCAAYCVDKLVPHLFI